MGSVYESLGSGESDGRVAGAFTKPLASTCGNAAFRIQCLLLFCFVGFLFFFLFNKELNWFLVQQVLGW